MHDRRRIIIFSSAFSHPTRQLSCDMTEMRTVETLNGYLKNWLTWTPETVKRKEKKQMKVTINLRIHHLRFYAFLFSRA